MKTTILLLSFAVVAHGLLKLEDLFSYQLECQFSEGITTDVMSVSDISELKCLLGCVIEKIGGVTKARDAYEDYAKYDRKFGKARKCINVAVNEGNHTEVCEWANGVFKCLTKTWEELKAAGVIN